MDKLKEKNIAFFEKIIKQVKDIFQEGYRLAAVG